MAYLYIVLSAVCSVLIAHLLKVTEVNNLRTLPTLTANYFFAGIIALVIGFRQQGTWQFDFIQPTVLIFCLVVGAFFIGNFMLYSKSVDTNGVGVTIAAMRVSLLVPVLVSIYLYSETITFQTGLGIVMVIGALVLLIPKKSRIKIGRMDAGWLLLMIFLIAGFADASLKVYEEEFRKQFNEQLFMSLVFGGAFLIGVISMLLRNDSFFTAREAGMGCIIGIPNLYSSVFLLYALTDVDGAIAYPIVNALNVGAGTALGLWLWNDKISGWQWGGIGIAVIAIILLI